MSENHPEENRPTPPQPAHTAPSGQRPSTPPQQPGPGRTGTQARPTMPRPPHGSALAGHGTNPARSGQPRPPQYRPGQTQGPGQAQGPALDQGPGQGQAQGHPQPPQTHDTDEKKTIFGMGRIKFAVVVLIIIAALIGIILLVKMLLSSGGSGEKSPEKAAQSFEDALVSDGIAAAWSTLSAMDRDYLNTLTEFAGSQLGEERLAVNGESITELLGLLDEVEITLTTAGREVTELSDDVARISYDSFEVKASYDPEALYAKISEKAMATVPWLVGDKADPRIGGRVEAALRGFVYDFSHASHQLSNSQIAGPDSGDFILMAVREDGGWQISPLLTKRGNEFYFGTEAEQGAMKIGQWDRSASAESADGAQAANDFFASLNEWATYCQADQEALAIASFVKTLAPAEARLYALGSANIDGCEVIERFSAAPISSDSTWKAHQAGPMSIITPDQVQINVLDHLPFLSDISADFADMPGLYTAHDTCMSGEARTVCLEPVLINALISTSESLRTPLTLDFDRALLGLATYEVNGHTRVSLAATHMGYMFPFFQFAEAHIAKQLDAIKYGK